MAISFGGIGEQVATFNCENLGEEGFALKQYQAGYVEDCNDGERFDLAFCSSDGVHAAAYIRGAVTAPYTGTAPGFGPVHLVAGDPGWVKLDAGTPHTLTDSAGKTFTYTEYTGREFYVVGVDTVNSTVTFII